MDFAFKMAISWSKIFIITSFVNEEGSTEGFSTRILCTRPDGETWPNCDNVRRGNVKATPSAMISGIAAFNSRSPELVLDEGRTFNERRLVLREDVVKR